ncbi:MAG: hypothetical protein HQK79_23130 [Desulfobacterales bacterium]|nr:hypothetical protein [Desulfobacterales bacterium]MBF0398308.1 hypothetical protein [Desulfobacterales bacterium]
MIQQCNKNTSKISPTIKGKLVDQVAFCMRDISDMLIHAVITFDGRIDYAIMKKAFRLCFDAEPITGCRLVTNDSQFYWKIREDLDEIAACFIKETNDIEFDINKFLTASIDPHNDSQVQALILRAENDTLCIKINHCIADAGGVKEYIYLLADVYSRLLEDNNYSPKLNIRGDRSLRQVANQFNFFEKLKIIRRSLRNLKSDSFYLLHSIRIMLQLKNKKYSHYRYWSLPLSNQDNLDRKILIYHIPKDQFCFLKSYGKRYNATVNDVILTAFYRAFFDIIKPDPNEPLHILTTADLRRYLPGNKGGAICNLSGFVHVNIGRNLGKDFEHTLIKAKNCMDSYKADYLGLGDFPSFVLFKLLPFKWFQKVISFALKSMMVDEKTVIPVLTNMGIIYLQPDSFKGSTIKDIFLTPPVMFPPILGIGITGFKEFITISVGICGSKKNSSIIKNLFDKVVDQLPLSV